MSNTGKWEQHGQDAVGAVTGIAVGVFSGIKGIGSRIKAAKYESVIEAFCAYTGKVAAQDGKLKQEEVDGFRQFLVDNRDHPVLKAFSVEDLVRKFRDYAVKEFLDEQQIFVTVLDDVKKGSDEAQLIVAGCLAVMYSNGGANPDEMLQIELLSNQVEVDCHKLQGGVPTPQPALPPPPPVINMTRPAKRRSPAPAVQTPSPAPAVQTPSPAPAVVTCTMCQDRGCVFCGRG